MVHNIDDLLKNWKLKISIVHKVRITDNENGSVSCLSHSCIQFLTAGEKWSKITLG